MSAGLAPTVGRPDMEVLSLRVNLPDAALPRVDLELLAGSESGTAGTAGLAAGLIRSFSASAASSKLEIDTSPLCAARSCIHRRAHVASKPILN